MGETSTTVNGQQELVAWEPPVQDLVEQYLNMLGFPKDFVLVEGGLDESELTSFNNDALEMSPDFPFVGDE